MEEFTCVICGSPKVRNRSKKCNPCRRLGQCYRQTSKWDLSYENSPKWLRRHLDIGKFDPSKLKNVALKAISEQVDYRERLKIVDSVGVDGITLEFLFGDISARVKHVDVGGIRSTIHGSANFFGHEFSQEQKRAINRFFRKTYYFIPMPSLSILIIHKYYSQDDI